MSSTIVKILVPVDFSPGSDAALDYALSVADACGAEVELLHVWAPGARTEREGRATIFAESAQGIAMEQRLTAAEHTRRSRVSGRLEFGEEASRVILEILEREPFDLVVMGREGGGRTSASVAERARCKVVTLAPGASPTAASTPGPTPATGS